MLTHFDFHVNAFFITLCPKCVIPRDEERGETDVFVGYGYLDVNSVKTD